jgi:hypothetical protein
MVEASEAGAWKVGGIKGQSLVGASTAARDGNGLDLGWVEKNTTHDEIDSGEKSNLHPQVKFQTPNANPSGFWCPSGETVTSYRTSCHLSFANMYSIK